MLSASDVINKMDEIKALEAGVAALTDLQEELF
jgi:hypothetical protein